MDRQKRTELFLQAAAHRSAVARLRAAPVRVGKVRALLHRWREQPEKTRSDVHWDEWEQLLTLPIDQFERLICADGEHATVLRSVSPIEAVISNAERHELLREARSA